MKKFIEILKYFLVVLFFILPVGCCGTKKTKQIPVVQVEKTVIKDSTIYIRDTIYIPLPTEEKEVKTTADSSHLETSLAKSDAWIDSTGHLNHTLKNKEIIYKYVYDTVVVTNTVTEYKEKPVIVEVEVPKQYIPKWCWLCVIFTVGVIVYIIIRIWLKFKVV